MRIVFRALPVVFFLSLLTPIVVTAQSAGGKPAQKSKTPPTQTSQPPSKGTTNPPETTVAGSSSLAPSQESKTKGTEYPADYIPCVFTLHELLGLRLTPKAATLTSGEAEDLKERLITEATTQADNGAMDPDIKSDFLTQIANEPLEGLTPSQALARVISILRTVYDERSPVYQLEYAAEETGQEGLQQLINVVNSLLSGLPTDPEQFAKVEANLKTGLKPEMQGVAKLTQLANNVSALQTDVKYYYAELEQTQKIVVRYLLRAAKEREAAELTGADRDKAEADLKNQSNQQDVAIRAIVDSARATIAAAFQRPQDVGCAMSILSFDETKYAFGGVVAKQYIGVQVIVRNLNDKQEFALHDAELSVDTDINSRFGRFYSGRDKLIVRGVSLSQSDFTARNLMVHIAEAVGTVMSAALPVAGTTFKDAVGVYNGGFIPGLKATWTDHSVDQLNLLSDIGFSSSTNYKTVVPKSGSVMFVIFIPSKQFEQGWWVQDCAQYLPVVSGWGPQTSPTSDKTPANVGIDLELARTMCRTYGEPATPPTGSESAGSAPSSSKTQTSDQKHAEDASEGSPNPQTTSATGKLPVPTSKSPETSSSTIFLTVKDKHYKNWSPTSLAIFRELAWAVVAGTHIQEVKNVSAITELKCPTDDVGNLILSKSSSVSCDVSGEGLDKIAVLRLENAQNATDTDTADGTVTVSGDPTKAKVTFQTTKLGNLNQPAYKVFAVTTTGVETFANQTLHFSLNPFETDVSPTSADPNKQASTQFTIKGFHLDKVAKIELFEGAYSKSSKALLPYDPDAGATANQIAFTLKSSDDDLKKKSSANSGVTLQVVFAVKDSSSVVPADSIKLQSSGPSESAAGLTLNPKALDFGALKVGSNSTKEINLVAGSSELQDLTFEITGDNSKSFSLTNSCSSKLEAKATCKVSVKFAPKASGESKASLDMSFTVGGPKQTQSASITGKTEAAPASGISLNPKSLTFAPQTKNTTSAAKITATNPGVTAVTGFTVTISGPNASDFGQTNTCGASLPAGKKCELEIKFTPSADGKLTATVNISFTVADKKQTLSVLVAGTGKT